MRIFRNNLAWPVTGFWVICSTRDEGPNQANPTRYWLIMGARSSRESAMDGYTPIPWGIKLHNPIAYPSEASSSVKPHARLSNGTTVRNDCNDVGFGLSAFE